jgi:hypothetical protein
MRNQKPKENKTKELSVPKMSPCSWMESKEKFYYLNDEKPYLVLYTNANPYPLQDEHNEYYLRTDSRPKFKEEKKWHNIMHQTAGYACHHYYIYARFLTPRKEILPLLDELLEDYNDSCINRMPDLKTATKYEKLLKKYGLSANFDYKFLEEGFYPIDIDFLDKVTTEKFPKDLQNLVVMPEKGKKKPSWNFLNYINFYLAVLGPNCD